MKKLIVLVLVILAVACSWNGEIFFTPVHGQYISHMDRYEFYFKRLLDTEAPGVIVEATFESDENQLWFDFGLGEDTTNYTSPFTGASSWTLNILNLPEIWADTVATYSLGEHTFEPGVYEVTGRGITTDGRQSGLCTPYFFEVIGTAKAVIIMRIRR